ncbi:MAG: hypothetical protein AABZ38_04285 [candidate division NC10 bacterium]
MSDRRGRDTMKQALLVIGLAVALSACATWRIEPTLPGPGVPTISNLRIEPEPVWVGEDVALTFDFEDTDADLVEARIYPSEVREWVYTPALAATVLNLKGDKYGRAVGSAGATFKWETEGTRILEVFVVDEQGHTSNKLLGRVTVTLQ